MRVTAMLLAGSVLLTGLACFPYGCQDQASKEPALEKTDEKRGTLPRKRNHDLPEPVLGVQGLKEKKSPAPE